MLPSHLVIEAICCPLVDTLKALIPGLLGPLEPLPDVGGGGVGANEQVSWWIISTLGVVGVAWTSDLGCCCGCDVVAAVILLLPPLLVTLPEDLVLLDPDGPQYNNVMYCTVS